MRNELVIVFTGGSSFTGYHFIKKLNEYNIKVWVFYSFKRNDIKRFTNIKKFRIKEIIKKNYIIYDAKFGSKVFIKKLKDLKKIDIFCHHHHYTKNYNQQNFELIKSINESTLNIEETLRILKEKKVSRYIYSGSYFSKTNNQTIDFSKYGLSKRCTFEIAKFFCDKFDINIINFIIPSVFGLYEDKKRLYTSLLLNLFNNKKMVLNFPKYQRDYIHIDVLSEMYKKSILTKKSNKILSYSYLRISNLLFCKLIQKNYNRNFVKRNLIFTDKIKHKHNEPLKKFNSIKLNTYRSNFYINRDIKEFSKLKYLYD